MPNLVDIVEIAQALEDKAVYVASERCVAVRNRHATCKKCVDACLAHAVSVRDNVLSIDHQACVGCGACTAVCPVEALIPLRPLDADLIAHAQAATAALDGAQAVFACARIASRGDGDPHKFTEVPCLGRMEESALLQLAAEGASDIVLVDGTCATCKYRATSPGVDATVASANALMEAMGAAPRVRRAQQFPDAALLQDRASLLGESRRGFFRGARTFAKDAAVKSAEVMVLKDSANQVARTLRDRLKATDAGTLPQFEPERRMRTLDAMDVLGAPTAPELDTRLFGSVSIDADACNACGMCTVFCPTGALKKSEIEPEPGGDAGSYLEFSAADCVQCNLCADACLKQCLTVEPRVPTAEVFDFEPRLIALPAAPARPGILSTFRGKR